jgi:hypothetical protein
MPEFSMSRHAITRASQRGIPHALVDALIRHCDVETPAGDGCTVLRLSRSRFNDSDLKQTMGSKVDRLKTLALVWSEASCEVVTVLHQYGADGRRYRRAH